MRRSPFPERAQERSVLVPVAGNASVTPTHSVFIPAARPAESPLTELTRALAGIRPELSRFAQGVAREQSIEDSERAARDALMSEARDWKEAIDSGQVQPGESPIYQRAWKETKGRAFGDSYEAEITTAWMDPSNAARNSDDPQAVVKWLESRRKYVLENSDPHFLNGALPRVKQAEARVLTLARNEFIQRVDREAQDALSSVVQSRVKELFDARLPAAEIAQALTNETLGARFAGMDGRTVNRITVAALIKAAEESGNEKILDVAYADRPDTRNPGAAVPGPGRIPELNAKLEAARDRIVQRAAAEDDRAVRAEARERPKRRRAAKRESLEALAEFDPDQIIALATEPGASPNEAVEYRRALRSYAQNYGRESHRGALYQVAKAAANGTEATDVITDMVAEGAISDPETLRRANLIALLQETAPEGFRRGLQMFGVVFGGHVPDSMYDQLVVEFSSTYIGEARRLGRDLSRQETMAILDGLARANKEPSPPSTAPAEQPSAAPEKAPRERRPRAERKPKDTAESGDNAAPRVSRRGAAPATAQPSPANPFDSFDQ